jgi:hypothetical protein
VIEVREDTLLFFVSEEDCAVFLLAILINRAKCGGQISVVIPNIINDGLSILQYVYDTILFMDHNLEQAQNMKLLLAAFE